MKIAETGLFLAGLMLFGMAAVEARTLQAVPTATQEVPSAPAPVMTDGPTLFRERGCAHCHAIKGVGGDKGPDLSGVGRRLKNDIIERQIVQGGDTMPAFGQSLPSEEIAALVSYLHKCKDKHKPAVKTVPKPPAAGADNGE